MKNKETYFGVVPPLFTPLASHEELDEKAYVEMLDHVLAGGVHGVFSMASSGESLHNSRDAWEKASKITLDVVKGRVPVYSGAIAASTSQVIKNIHYLEDLGADIAVVTAPFYTPCLMQSELKRHFESILDHTEMKLCIYNIPGLIGGIEIGPEIMTELADEDRIVMIKDSSPNWDHQQRMLFALKDKDISVMTGGETFATSSIVMGAQGNISGFAVTLPKLFVAAYDAAKACDMEKVKKIQEEILCLMDLMKMNASAFSIMKYSLAAIGIGTDINAYHTEPLTAEQKRNVEEKIKELMSIYG